MVKIPQLRKNHHHPNREQPDNGEKKIDQVSFKRLKFNAEIVVWFLLAVLFFLLGVLSWYYRPNQVNQLLKTADTSFKNGRYELSYALLNKAVLLDNSNPEIHYRLAEVYEATDNWPEAKKELLLALELSTNSEVIGKELTKVNTVINEPGRIKAEIGYWEKETITKPDYRDAYLQLAVRYFQLYRTDLAKQNLQKAFSLDPNFEITKKLMGIIK